MNKLNILFVCNNFKPSWEAGGEVRFVYDLAKALVVEGHRVTVFTNNYYKLDYGVQTNTPLDVDGITVYYFDNIMSRFPSILLPPLPLSISKKALNQVSGFDIIHIHGHRNYLEAAVCRRARSWSVPYLLQGHGSVPHHDKKLMKTVFDRLLGDRIIRDAKAIIISTPKEKRDYESIKAPTNHFVTIANGIDLSSFLPLPKKGSFRQKMGLAEGSDLFLFVGRINAIKNLEMMIDAFHQLVIEAPASVLALVGPVDDDGYLQKLKDYVKEKGVQGSVLFCGPLYGLEKLYAYVDADVYVQSSKYESFANSIVESLAVGTPVIVSKHCNISEELSEMGMAVDHDAHSFYEAMKLLISNPTLRRQYGQKGSIAIPERYDIHRMVHEYIRVYNEAARQDND